MLNRASPISKQLAAEFETITNKQTTMLAKPTKPQQLQRSRSWRGRKDAMKFFSLQDSFRNLDGTCAADRTTGRPPLKPSECLLLLDDVGCNCFAGYGANIRRLCVDV